MIVIYRALPEQYPILKRNETRCQLIDSCLDVTIKQTFELHRNMREIGEENKYTYFFPKKKKARVYVFDIEYMDENDNTILELQSKVQEKQEAKETALEAAANGKSAQVMEVDGDNYKVEMFNPPEACTKVIMTVRYCQSIVPIDTMKNNYSMQLPLLILLDSRENLPPQKFYNYPAVHDNVEFHFSFFVRTFANICQLTSPSHQQFFNVVKEDERNYMISFRTPLTWAHRQLLGAIQVFLEVEKKASSIGFLQSIDALPSAESFKQSFGNEATPVKLNLSIPEDMENNRSTCDNRNYMFIVDRSDSMQGEAIENCKKALNLLLSSLPQGSTFNICSFGSHHSFLFGKGFQEYNEINLEKARTLIGRMSAVFGGTKLVEPIKRVIGMHQKQMKALPASETVVFLLTDGAVRDTEEVLKLVRDGVHTSENEWKLRFFTLGIGNEVSRELVSEVANQGGGTSIFLLKHQRMNSAVAKQLQQVMVYPLAGLKFELNPEVAEYTQNKLLNQSHLHRLSYKSVYPGDQVGSDCVLINLGESFRAASQSEVIGTIVATKTGTKGEVRTLGQVRKQDFDWVDVNLFGEMVDSELTFFEEAKTVPKSAKKRITQLAVCANLPSKFTSLVSVSTEKTNEATEEDRILPPVVIEVVYYTNGYQNFGGSVPLGGSLPPGVGAFTARRVKKKGARMRGARRCKRLATNGSQSIASLSEEVPPFLRLSMAQAEGLEEDFDDKSDMEEEKLVIERSASKSNNPPETFFFKSSSLAKAPKLKATEVLPVYSSKDYELLDEIVLLQKSNGSFEIENPGRDLLLEKIGLSSLDLEEGMLTALTIVFLENKLAALRNEWEMVHQKAQEYLSSLAKDEGDLMQQAAKMLGL